MKIENNNIDVPSCYDEKFFSEALKNGLARDDIEIKEITFTMGSSGGDNYCSDIYRARLMFTTPNGNLKTISLIIKSMPKAEEDETFKKLAIYPKENIMYFKVLPRVEELLRGTKISPKCFYAQPEPIHTMVFEDMKDLEYEVQNRETGVDAKHGKIVLRKLAKYHAATMVLARDRNDLMENFKDGIIHLDDSEETASMQMFGKSFQYARTLAENWPGYESIAAKMQKIEGSFIRRIVKSFKSESSRLRVLNHGDMWVNNMMFKYDENQEVSDVIFIDYQLSFYQSAGVDINYFLYTSIQCDELDSNRDDMIAAYHESLESAMEDLGLADIPTLAEVQEEIRRSTFYGLLSVCGILPIISMSREFSADNSIETITKSKYEEKRAIMFQSDRVQNMLKYSLKYFNEIGTFDQLIKAN